MDGYHIFLDDERYPADVTWKKLPDVDPRAWFIPRNYDQFTSLITSFGVPGFVSFDHDLGWAAMQAAIRGDENYGEEKTGYHCAVWLVHYCADHQVPFPEYQVHSMNPVGAEKIRGYIENAIERGYIDRG